MQKKYTDLILTGSISIDRIMNFSGHYHDLIQADKLHVLSLSVLIDKLNNSRGGTAANIAYNAAMLKLKPILLASLGKDAGNYLMDLKKIGVNIDYINQSDLPTATFTVMTDLSDNQIGGFYPGAMSDISKLTLEPWYDTKSLVVISANDPLGMDQLVKECQAHDLDYIYDVGQQVTNISIDQLKLGLSKAKILFVNDYELGTILGRTEYTQKELEAMIPIIVTTLGSKGTSISGSSQPSPLQIPAVSSVKVVDPTGAGDAYRAGFLYGYLQDLSLQTCAELGSTVATYTIKKHGTQTHTFTLDELIKKHYSAYEREIL